MHPEKDLALMGEFHRIAHQVHQYLPQPQRIPDDKGWHLWPDMIPKPQPRVSSLLIKKVKHALDTFPQFETPLLDLHFARIYLGIVQDIIDNTQQTLAAIEDRSIVLPLLGRQGGLRQQRSHPD